MKLYVEASEDMDINDAFIPSCQEFEYYDNLFSGILIPPTENCVLFLSMRNNVFSLPESELRNWLNNFFKNNSFLIITQKLDSTLDLLQMARKLKIPVLNDYNERILIYYTGTIEEQSLKKFLDLKLIKKQESEFITRISYYYNGQPEVVPRTNNYLLTTIVKENRPHRMILFTELQKQNLIAHQIGKIHFGDVKDRPNFKEYWVGNTAGAHNWVDGVVSWDLYNRASFEIVPETFYQDCSWLTEKTLKPIVAKIPFLTLSNVDFYKDLKKIGFKTFDSLIDESFAYEPMIELRTQKLVATAKSIIDQGSLDFFNAAQDICNYNFDHLMFLRFKDEYCAYVNLMNFKNYI